MTCFRDEMLKAGTTRLVNFQYHQPLSQFRGSGKLSMLDGQRYPVSGKVRMATALPRCFGFSKGVIFYTWTADQFSQYGTKAIPSTMRLRLQSLIVHRLEWLQRVAHCLACRPSRPRLEAVCGEIDPTAAKSAPTLA